MTAYALRLENDTDTAARVRAGDALGLTADGATTARQGIRPGVNAGAVAVVNGTMQVTVQPFSAWIKGGVSATQNGYPFVSDASVTLTLANGHPTLTRVDVVAAVVHDDPFDGSGLIDASVTVVQGTPGGGAPTLPANCLPLRNVSVPAGRSIGNGGLSAANLSTDRRTYTTSLGGVLTVATQAERDALPAVVPTMVYRSDLDALQVRTSAGWRSVPVTERGAWTAYTPALFNGHVAGSGGLAGRYRLLDDKTLELQITYTIGAGASLPAQIIFGLPPGITAAVTGGRTQSVFLRWYNGGSGQFVGFASTSTGYAGGTQLGCVQHGGTPLGGAAMGTTGSNLDLNGIIELA